jgi:GT2 family glycosyltransferase
MIKNKCSVIIPTCNEGEFLMMTIESILQNTLHQNYEIVVVDDGSTDGSTLNLENKYKRVKVVKGNKLGVAGARNLGVDSSKGEYLIFIDAHCKVSKGWMKYFINALGPADVAMVGPCFTQLDKPEPKGCGMKFLDESLETTWFEPFEADTPFEVPLSTGACQAFKRATFEAVGKYEEGFTRWGSEDIEICIRLWLLGYRLIVEPKIIVQHYFRENRNYEVDDTLIIYNFLRMIYMHFSEEKINAVLDKIKFYSNLPKAKQLIEKSNVYELREELFSVRVLDDNWYFETFMPDVFKSRLIPIGKIN